MAGDYLLDIILKFWHDVATLRQKTPNLGWDNFFGTVMLNHPILNKHLIWYVAQTFSEKDGFLTQTSKKKEGL